MDLRSQIDKATRTELLQALGQIAHRLALTEPTEADQQTEDQLMTTKDTAKLISMTPASIDTYVSAGKLIEGIHFFRKGRRRLFSKKAMWAWATATKEVTNQEPEIEPFITTRRRTS